MTSHPSRFGLKSADNFALFLKVFSGEVLTAFEKTTVMRPLLRERAITSGKSAQFPVVGVATAAYHVPGENLLETAGASASVPKYLSRPGTEEKVILIDELLTSSTLIHQIDEAMAHWDVRADYSTEIGRELAYQWDTHLMQVVFHGSEDAVATLTGEGSWGKLGKQIIDSDFETSGNSFLETMRALAQNLDDADVPDEGRYIVIRPKAWHLMAQQEKVVSSDYNAGTGGDIGRAAFFMIQGYRVYKSTIIDRLRALGNVISAAAGQRGTDYTGDFTNTVAIAGQRMGAGTVRLKNLTMESEYIIEHQAQFMLGKYAVGHGILHPAACQSVVTA